MSDAPKTTPEQLPDGIHFGVPEDVYFAQDALGSTELKQLAVDPIEFQFTRLRVPDKETPAKTWGSAFHCRVLEGETAYVDKFQIAPVPADFEDLIVTTDDAKAWLAERNHNFKSNLRKPDLLTMIRKASPKTPIWDDIKAEFEMAYPEEFRITPEIDAQVRLACDWMQADAKLAPVMEDGSFKYGAPEVTIIFTIDGVRFRVRLDYLLPGPRLLDLKSFRPWRPGQAYNAVIKALGEFRYDIQAAHYTKGFDIAREFFQKGMVFGEEPYDGYLEAVFGSDEELHWLWVFVKAQGAPIPTVVELPQRTFFFQNASNAVEAAITNYRTYLEKFGHDQLWLPDPSVFIIDDTDIPSWFGT